MLNNTLWMEIDLKVRKLISDLLEPSLSKLHSIELFQSKIYSSHRIIKDRVKNLEDKVAELPGKIPMIDPINKRIAEHSLKITSVELETKAQCENITNDVDSLSSKFGNMISNVASASSQIENIRKDLRNYLQCFVQLREFVEGKVNELKSQVKEPFVNQAETNIVLQVQIKQIEKNLQNMNSEFAALELKSKKSERKLNSGITGFQEQVQGYIEESKKITGGIEEVYNEQSKIKENIEEQMQKFREEIQKNIEEAKEKIEKGQRENIEDILHFVLMEPRYKKKIADYKKNHGVFAKEHSGNDEESLSFQNEFRKKYKEIAEGEENSEVISEAIREKKNIRKKKREKEIQFMSEVRENTDPSFVQFDKPVESNELLINAPEDLQLLLGEEIKIPIVVSTENLNTKIEEHGLFLTKPPANIEDLLQLDVDQSKHLSSQSISDSQQFQMNNADYLMVIEDIQSQLEKSRQEILSLQERISSIEIISTQNFQFLNQKIILIDQKLEKSISDTNEYSETELKPWVSECISVSCQGLLNKLTQLNYEKNQEIERILINHSELESNLKQYSYEFSTYIMNKRREQSDFKLEFKRIYTKIEESNKKHTQIELLVDKANSTLRVIKNIIVISHVFAKNDENFRDRTTKRRGSQVVREKNCENIIYKSKEINRSDLLERQERLIESICGDLEEKRKTENHTNHNLRSLTPELPSINKSHNL